VSIRSKQTLAVVRVLENNCLALNVIYYSDEVRPVDQVPNLPKKTVVKANELQLAEMLIDQLSGPFQPEKYQDEYRVGLLGLIHKKVSGEEITYMPEQPTKTVLDLNLEEALQASIDLQVAKDAAAKKSKKKVKAG
jgi:DNA end-binding protein Ku